MNWSDLITKLVAVAAACGTLLKCGSWIAGALKDRAKALQAEAVARAIEAREYADLKREVAEMRTNVANYLARTGDLETAIGIIKAERQAIEDFSARHGIVQR